MLGAGESLKGDRIRYIAILLKRDIAEHFAARSDASGLNLLQAGLVAVSAYLCKIML